MLPEHWLGKTQVACIARGTTKNATQHIATSFVAWMCAVGNRKRQRADVICNHTHRNAIRIVELRTIGTSAEIFRKGNDRLKHIRVVIRILLLHHCAQTFEAHASIDMRRRQVFKLTSCGAVVLDEHVVPDLNHFWHARVYERST